MMETMVLGITNTSSYTFADIGDYPKVIYLPNTNKVDDITFGGQQYVGDNLGEIKYFDLGITSKSENVSKHLGDEATLSVEASMTNGVPFDTLSYQWEKKDIDGNWSPIVGATQNELTFNALTVNDGGNYRCVITPDSYPSMKKMLETTITIVPYEADFDDTAVSGILEGETYETGKSIEFTVDGAGMNRTTPFEGDIRYEPRSWQANGESGTLPSPYKGTINTSNLPVGETTLEITFVKQQYKNGNWEDTATIRTSYVKNITFTVTKYTNTWTTEPSISDWTYGETANTPVAQATAGTATFSYSNQENGTFTSTVPTQAGIWYMKASVSGVTDFNNLEKTISFTIRPKAMSALTISDINKEEDIANLTIHDGSKQLVLDTDYTVETIADGLKRTIHITGKGNYTGTITKEITLITNTWTKEPSIVGWTYGETANTPVAEATTGATTFSYSNQENGTFTSEVPTQVGTWYMKAIVPRVINYSDLEKTISFTITPKAMSALTISDINKEEDIANLTIHDGSKLLVLDTDYTVETIADGLKRTVKVTGKGNYTGFITKEFSLNPIDIATLTISEITKEADITTFTIHDGNKLLILNKDYTVQTKVDGEKTIVTITGKGNYKGTITKEFTTIKPPVTGIDSSFEIMSVALLISGCAFIYEYRKNKLFKK